MSFVAREGEVSSGCPQQQHCSGGTFTGYFRGGNAVRGY